MFKKFIRFYKPYKKLFILDLLAASLAAAIDLVYPMMTREIVDNATNHGELRVIGVFAVTLIILFLINGGKRNGSKDQIKKNGTEEGSFLQNYRSRFPFPQRR